MEAKVSGGTYGGHVYKGRSVLDKGHAEGGGPYYLDFSEATDEEIAYIEWSISNEGTGYTNPPLLQGRGRTRLTKESLGIWRL